MIHDRKWDEAYRTGAYKGYWGIQYPSQELVSFIATMDFPKNTICLDVGCGAGQESIFLAQQGFQVIGVDLSAEGLKIAQQKAIEAGVTIDWHLSNVLELSIQEQMVDMINDRGCFHVISDEHRTDYACEMARVLKPGGKILIRGCRDPQEDHFNTVTAEAIHHYFDQHFTWSSVLPIQLCNGHSPEGLDANLVVLTRKLLP